MDSRHYLSCGWPGLPELWWRGQLSTLPLAIGFGMGLNALLVLRYLLPSWLNPTLVSASWWIGIAFWIGFVVKQIRELPILLTPRQALEVADEYPEANEAYLRGDWEQAESKLMAMLRIEPRDPPALLLLSGVYRHTDRIQNAQALLAEMRRIEACDGWQIEVEAEQSRVEQLIQSADDEDAMENSQENDTDGNGVDRENEPAELTENPRAA
ncbi:MAG: hypothetical protein AAFV88_21845 [Planctomycetota bacterium]